MSQAYQRLREGLPQIRRMAAGHFAADVRQARAWAAALPRANSQVTQQELSQALNNLSVQDLQGALRFSVLEELRSSVVESIELLQQQYAGSALPLTSAKATAAQQAEAFHLALAHAYRKATVELCAPAGAVAFLRGKTVGQALARSTWHYAQALSVAWRIYRAPSSGVWQGLHRVHAFAVELNLESKSVADKSAGAPIEIGNLYVQALLIAIANPLAFSQIEQDSLWQISRGFAPRCVLLRNRSGDNAPVVPDDADHGPGQGVIGENQTQWLDIQPFSREVESALQNQKSGFSTLSPTRGVAMRVSEDMLQRLMRSFGLAAARSHKRLPAGHELRTVFGLSSLHFYLAGLRDFDTFMTQVSQHIVHVVDRAVWASDPTDVSRVPILSATAVDQSLGGYQIAWENGNQIRARVGELVGITFAQTNEDPDWMVGVVRWLRYEDNGGLLAGVELISRHAVAVGMRVLDNNDAAQAATRCIEMDMLDGSAEHCFLTAAGLDAGAIRVEVVRESQEFGFDAAPLCESFLAGLDMLLNAGDYVVLRPLRGDSVIETAVGEAVT